MLRSSLPDGLEGALWGDERCAIGLSSAFLYYSFTVRCCLDAMRFIDLLLLLLFEGRRALPKNPSRASYNHNMSSGRLDGSGPERFHRQVIDAIRNSDMGTLIEAIELLGKWRRSSVFSKKKSLCFLFRF